MRFDGDPRARERPIGTVLDALRVLGARIEGPAGSAGSAVRSLPFTLDAVGSLPGGEVVIDASESSQFVSGLLLSGSRYEKGVTVVHDGKPVRSLPHIDPSTVECTSVSSMPRAAAMLASPLVRQAASECSRYSTGVGP